MKDNTKIYNLFFQKSLVLGCSSFGNNITLFSTSSNPIYVFHCSNQNKSSIAQILNTIDLGIFKIIAMANMSLTMEKLLT